MPRKRRAAREFQGAKSVVERVKERFDNSWGELEVNHHNFYDHLPTAEERSAFAKIFPEWFYEMFQFRRREKVYPSDVIYDCNVFNRADVAAFLAEYKPATDFEPPDLRTVPYPDQYITLARARGAWWKANKLPMTAAEREWLKSQRSEIQ